MLDGKSATLAGVNETEVIPEDDRENRDEQSDQYDKGLKALKSGKSELNNFG